MATMTTKSSDFDSSTDDEEEIKSNCNKPCKISKTLIYSNYSNNEKLKYYPTSFSFDIEDNIMEIQFHPMFLWRLINYQNNDCNQFKTHISKYLKKQFIIYVHPTFVFHNNIKQSVEHELYSQITTLYNRLHSAIKRNYEIDNILDELLQKAVDILMCIHF
jgi:hypothetical protein